MKRITSDEMKMLRAKGLIKDKTRNQEPNYYVANKQHSSRAKTYFVTEELKIKKALGVK